MRKITLKGIGYDRISQEIQIKYSLNVKKAPRRRMKLGSLLRLSSNISVLGGDVYWRGQGLIAGYGVDGGQIIHLCSNFT